MIKKSNLPIITYKTDCPIKEDCFFNKKNFYTKEEMEFYMDYCLRGGESCGLKKNHDLSERLKENYKRRLEKND